MKIRKIIYTSLTLSIFVMSFNLLIVNLFRTQAFAVTSSSMNPDISKGSLIYVLSKNNYDVNDVVTFNSNNRNITHRIVGVQAIGNEIYFQTKGDANKIMDGSLVNKDEIIGETRLIIPYLGSIMMFLKSPLGFAAGIVLPMMIFLLYEVRIYTRKCLGYDLLVGKG